jgi:hypothetical protein
LLSTIVDNKRIDTRGRSRRRKEDDQRVELAADGLDEHAGAVTRRCRSHLCRDVDADGRHPPSRSSSPAVRLRDERFRLD